MTILLLATQLHAASTIGDSAIIEDRTEFMKEDATKVFSLRYVKRFLEGHKEDGDPDNCSIAELRSLLQLITAPGTPLIKDDRSNADDVLRELWHFNKEQREPLVRLIAEAGAPLITPDRGNAAPVLDSFFKLCRCQDLSLGELESLVRLIRQPDTKLLANDGHGEDAHNILNELAKFPKKDMEPVVRIITAPATRFISENGCTSIWSLPALYDAFTREKPIDFVDRLKNAIILSKTFPEFSGLLGLGSTAHIEFVAREI